MEREKDRLLGCTVGAFLVFAICLMLGVLDYYNYLDKILDFLHIP